MTNIMTAFDPMAVVVDWLDAYRAARLDTMLSLYDDAASLECSCGGQKILVGKDALREYWRQRFAERGSIELEDLQPEGDEVALAYTAGSGRARVVFSFSASGKIAQSRGGPAAAIEPLRPGRS
jgi:ketosteroid isomerase-like protein